VPRPTLVAQDSLAAVLKRAKRQSTP
jgi:hypothetical protein